MEEMKEEWDKFSSKILDLNLPLAPKKFLNYFE